MMNNLILGQTPCHDHCISGDGRFGRREKGGRRSRPQFLLPLLVLPLRDRGTVRPKREKLKLLSENIIIQRARNADKVLLLYNPLSRKLAKFWRSPNENAEAIEGNGGQRAEWMFKVRASALRRFFCPQSIVKPKYEITASRRSDSDAYNFRYLCIKFYRRRIAVDCTWYLLCTQPTALALC